MYVVELSKENVPLSVAELISLLGNGILLENYFFVSSVKKIKRLSYSKNAFKLLFSCDSKNFVSIVKKIKWDKLIKKKYKLFYEGVDDVSDVIWHSLSKPKVDIKNPSQEICFIRIGKKVFCCEKVWGNVDGFKDRFPHKRKGLKPISLKPKLARCLVNLSGCLRGKIVDPFCGTGGILIEGIFCGLNVFGFDISNEMVSIAKESCKNYGKVRVEVKDFFFLGKTNYIVTELPFGKNTKSLSDGFYGDVVRHLGKILGKRAVVVFPGYVNVSKMISGSGLILVDMHKYYVHKSMTRQICVFEK